MAHNPLSPEVASELGQDGPDGPDGASPSGEQVEYPSPVVSGPGLGSSPESPDDNILGLQMMSFFDTVSSDDNNWQSPAPVSMDPYSSLVASPKCRNGIGSPLGKPLDLQVWVFKDC